VDSAVRRGTQALRVTADALRELADVEELAPGHAMTTLSREGRTFGTAGYLAPEQALGRNDEISERTDLYSLGSTLFRVVTGELPHLGETPQELIVAAATADPRTLAERRLLFRDAAPALAVVDPAARERDARCAPRARRHRRAARSTARTGDERGDLSRRTERQHRNSAIAAAEAGASLHPRVDPRVGGRRGAPRRKSSLIRLSFTP